MWCVGISGGGGGKNVKPWKNDKNSKIARMVQRSLENSLDLG